MLSGWYNPNTHAGDAGIIFNQADAPQAGEALIIAPHSTASSATSLRMTLAGTTITGQLNTARIVTNGDVLNTGLLCQYATNLITKSILLHSK